MDKTQIQQIWKQLNETITEAERVLSEARQQREELRPLYEQLTSAQPEVASPASTDDRMAAMERKIDSLSVLLTKVLNG